MRSRALLLAGLGLLLVAAAQEPPAGEQFGAPLTLSEATPIAQLLRAPERFADAPVLIRGRISDVCQKKGCWTVIRDGEAHVRVRFADYGFFVPKDSSGADVWAQGTLTLTTLSEKQARHYAAEGMDGDPNAIHGAQREVGFLATGVRILRSQ